MKFHRGQDVVFIELGLVRQAHRDELVTVITYAYAQLSAGPSGQQACVQGIDAATNA